MSKLKYISLLLCGLIAGFAQAADTRDSEALLVRSLQSINDNHLDSALNQVDKLLHTNPNFRLAQLVKGDLLMARAGALNHFGDAENASNDQIDDLRDEARVRLNRILSPSDTKLVPRFLWQLDAEQKYVLVVDTSRSTLFVYQNVNGEPRYVTDFYVTIGKLGTKKVSEGDQRTPIGVYFIASDLSKTQLPDMYGSGAFPLSYPNEWDEKNNHTGKGIWLHGTPSDTYSRPPKASNGCVVLTNEDLNKLAPYLQIGVTPVIIASQIDASTDADQSDHATLMQEIEQWRKDWSSLDTNAYLKHYSASFANDNNMNYAAWAKQKQLVNSGKSWVKVGISNVSVFAYPDQPNMVVVNFEQDYNSNNLANKMKKRQYWIKQNNTWKIIYEGAA
jgi:murein L,D-transpeptidase YafK